MLRHLTRRRWLIVVLGLFAVVVVMLFAKWRDASNRGGQKPAQPFRIAGNLYYVGANDVTSFLITGPEGHVLIDGGYPGTAPMIMASIAKLGFKITDVKVLLNSHAHFDHAGGLAELQKASGAELWVSEGDADIVGAGGAGDPFLGPFRFVTYLPILRYPAPRVDHRFKDGAKVHLGPIELTAHITAGHTPGCTSWSFPVRDGDRELLVVEICSLTLPPALSFGKYPGIRADLEHSFQTLRSLPADIWLASHAREFGRWRKYTARANAKNPADTFIDRAGYLAYIDSAEMRYRKLIAERR
jgi:metallo-beta-lactamase class B